MGEANRSRRLDALLRALARLDRGVETVERWVLAGGVLGMAAVGIANVFARNVLGHSLTFAAEVSQLLVVLVTFLGIGYGVRHARHIRMAAFYDQLSGRWRKGLMVLICLGTAALLFTLAVLAVGYVVELAGRGRVTAALRLPLYWVYVWVPVGFLLGGLQYLLAAVRNLTSPGVHLSFQQKEAYEPPGGGG